MNLKIPNLINQINNGYRIMVKNLNIATLKEYK